MEINRELFNRYDTLMSAIERYAETNDRQDEIQMQSIRARYPEGLAEAAIRIQKAMRERGLKFEYISGVLCLVPLPYSETDHKSNL